MKKTVAIFLSILALVAFLGISGRALAQEEPAGYQQETSAYNNFKNDKGLSGDLRIDQFSGAVVYNYALTIPGGRNGLQPSLNLYYNSHDRSVDSWVGQGWSLSLGSVTRSTRKGSNQLYTSNEFSLFLNGSSCDLALIDEQNQEYGCKAEASFNKVEYDSQNNYWIVTDTLGVKYYFGQANASRQDSSDHSLVYQWLLDKVVDTNDNFYRLEYFKNQGQIYPETIYYTGHDQTDGPMVIEFNLEARGDTSTSYAPQFLVTTAYRLDNIEITVDGGLQTKYDLSYVAGQNGRTSLFSSITQKGYENQTEYSLPATTFDYAETNAGWIEDTENWSEIAPFAVGNYGSDNPPVLMDFNGDSWVDLSINFHTGFGWEGSGWAWPQQYGDNNWKNISSKNMIIGDINGDKYPDIIASVRNGYYVQIKVYINNQVNGFNFSNEWTDALPQFFDSEFFFLYNGQATLTDVNNDGLDDIVYAWNHGASTTRAIYLNTGSGWGGGYGNFPTSLVSCQTNNWPLKCSSVGTQIVDVNGDGLVDVVRSGDVYLNTGAAFSQEASVIWSLPEIEGTPQHPVGNVWEYGGARFTDLNSDGLIDVTIAASYYGLGGNGWDSYETFLSYINSGQGWTQNNNWNSSIIIGQNSNVGNRSSDVGVRLMDINNDGAIDIVKSYCNDCQTDTEREVYLGQGKINNLLTKINNGYGAETNLEYQASGRYFDDQNEFKNPDLPINLQTVKSITTADGQGNDLTTDYDYQDGRYYADPDYVHHDDGYTLNQFVGFGEVTAVTQAQTVKSYYHQGGGVDGYELGEYEDSIYKKGRVYREEVYENDTLMSLKINRWEEENLGNDRQFVYLSDSLAYDVGSDGQQQFLGGGELDEGPGEVDGTYLADLHEAQNFQPEVEPQLVSESEDGLSKVYYLGRDEDGQQRFQFQVYSGQPDQNNELDEIVDQDFNTVNGDGELLRQINNNCDNFLDAVDAAQANQVYNGEVIHLYNTHIGDVCALGRVYLPFQTQDLPDDAIIISAYLQMNSSYTYGASLATILVNVPNQNPGLLDGRWYGNFGDTRGSEDVYIFDADEYSWDFNSTALTWINLDGYTPIGLRGFYDFYRYRENIFDSQVNFYASESQNPDLRPLLVIEYTLNHAPNVPSDLEIEGQINPDDIADQTPEFTAIYNDDNEEDQAVSYQLQVIRTGGSFDYPLWDSGQQDLNTPIVVGERSEEISYGGDDLPLEGFQYFWRIKFWDDSEEFNNEGLWSDGVDYFYMDGSAAPTEPTGLLTEDRIEPRGLINQTPSFSAIYHDPNPIDSAKWYRIQVDNNSDFSSPTWDSDKTLLNNLVDNGSWSEAMQYGGDALPYDGTTYYWRIKFWDDEGESGTEGAYSEASTFSMFDLDDLLTDVRIKGAKYHYDFTNGNLLQEENFGEVTAANNGIYLDEEGDEKNTDYDYAEPTNPNSHIIAAPKEKVLSSPNNFEEVSVELYYDDLAFGQVTSANVTKEDMLVEAVEYEKDFNDYGLVVETRDPLEHATTIVYDDDYYYPAETVNHLNQTTLTEYDLTTGQLIRSEDPNGLVEERDYDAFGRLIEVRRTDPDNVQNLITLQTYQYNDVASPSWAKQSVKVDGQNWLDTYTYFDGLGRTLQTREESDNGDYIVVSYKYDSRGNLERQSIPYVQNGLAYTQPTWDLAVQPYTSYEYDGRNRVTSETFQSSTQSWTTAYDYDGWNVLITDAEGHQKKLYKDAYGQLIKVDEYLDQQVYSTIYEYNLLGKLTKITDSQDNKRNFTYDSLGRLTSQEEMHTVQAGNFGAWSYEYDDASNLISKTDPKDQTVEYDYDNLNRLISEDFMGLPGTEVVYNYDLGTYAIGRLYKASFGLMDDDVKNFGYDVWGRVISEYGTVNDHDYDMAFSYTLTSQPDAISYIEPEEYGVSYGYDALGRGISLTVLEPNEDPVDLIDNVSYSPLKQIAGISYTNGTETANTFDPLQAYRLTNKLTVDDQDNIMQDLDYTYDDVGNITGLLDESETILAKTTGYTYDDLYRLTSATVANSANNQDYARTYSYDPIGNITNKSDIGIYQYQNDNPYQVNAIGTMFYQYDDNGNLIQDANQNYHYNHNDRLMNVNHRTLPIISLFDYDHTGQRVYKKVDDASQGLPQFTETIYPNKYLEFDYLNGDYQMAVNITKHLYFGNQRIGQVKKFPTLGQPFNVINLVFTDHLGSSSLVTDEDGLITAVYDYYPYGDSRIADEMGAEVNNRFTGQELDEETDLHYFGQRYYAAAIAKFNRQDPIALKLPIKLLNDPQQLNTYSYVRNNPLRFIDPTGLLTIIVPGTNYNEKDWSDGGSAQKFVDDVKDTFNETHETKVLHDKENEWSGEDNDKARQEAADWLTDYISGYDFAEGEELNIVGHSHGGNIGILASQKTNRKIDNLVTLGTPARSDYQPNYDNIGRHINAYSNLDVIQSLGGGQSSVSKYLGSLFGPLGGWLGGKMNFGEFGLSGRTFEGAENVDVTKESGHGLLSSHLLWQYPEVWKKIDN